ncbi:MAG: hypothetical protein KIT68_13095 [Phycisphaeraceae bacterium]|nr:hypothetical protein [Phycisphaeraceae bacterium]
MSSTGRAHLVQSDNAWEDKTENFARISRLLDAAPIAPGDLVVLVEMFDTGFSFNLSKTADTDGRTLEFIRGTAAGRGVTLQGSRTVLGPEGKGRNRVTVAGPDGSVLCEYDKIHPFSFGREGEHFIGGTEVTTYRWGGTVVCPLICYDLRFPEAFRAGMRMGAEVFTVPANWPAPRKTHRRALGIARAIENQAYVLCVNRVGQEPPTQGGGGVTYDGGSYAADFMGEIVADGDDGRSRVLSVGLDLQGLRRWREKFPALRDARLLDRPA